MITTKGKFRGSSKAIFTHKTFVHPIVNYKAKIMFNCPLNTGKKYCLVIGGSLEKALPL